MLLHFCAVVVVSMCLNLQYLRNRFDKGLNTFACKGFNSTPHKIKTPWQEKMNYLLKLNIYNETFFFYLRFFFFLHFIHSENQSLQIGIMILILLLKQF